MPTSRPKLMLDEQSFQDMLAAAFTIQEHNERRKKALQPKERVCGQCGAPVEGDGPLCQRCADQPRPGEELQRKWASLWMMSQEQGLGPESFSAALQEAPGEDEAGGPNLELQVRRFPEAVEIPVPTEGVADGAEESELEWEDSSVAIMKDAVVWPELTAVASPAQETVDAAAAGPGSLRDLRLKLRFHRADLYLVLSVAVSTLAMIWVLSATPAPGAHRKPQLRLWERALISVGLAEAPEPETPQGRGNPNISVWVDPKTALYYCVGEELYGKAPGGHLATQREAQLDQFEPAGRVACE